MAGLKYQEAIEDVRSVSEPAEERFLALQTEFEDEAVRVFEKCGAACAAMFVTEYTNTCLESVDSAYGELVDYLMFKYLYSYSSASPSRPLEVKIPSIPE